MNDFNPLSSPSTGHSRSPWNKGKIIGPRPPLRRRYVWSTRAKLHLEQRVRDLVLFNLAIEQRTEDAFHGPLSFGWRMRDQALACERRSHSSKPMRPRIAIVTGNHARLFGFFLQLLDEIGVADLAIRAVVPRDGGSLEPLRGPTAARCRRRHRPHGVCR
jgi:hypothetical protein